VIKVSISLLIAGGLSYWVLPNPISAILVVSQLVILAPWIGCWIFICLPLWIWDRLTWKEPELTDKGVERLTKWLENPDSEESA